MNMETNMNAKTISTVDFMNDLSEPGMQVMAIPIDDIRPDPDQPRKSLAPIDGVVDEEDQQKLEMLAASIADEGLYQPILVREMPDGDYQIIAGERRWRATRLNRERGVPNSDTINAMVRQDLTGAALVVAQLSENLQRDDLTDLETAATLKVLFTKFPELQKQQIAKILKLRNSHISRLLALLDPQWAHVVNSGIITYASLLEQFKSLPEDARNELVSTAKSEERPLTSTDLKKMRAKK
ncbi:ParB/RepB/Spo0J family partition protein [Undibacterium arcticum]|uniref:ParB/RepB/Spo0J family partition protein n=1 Tax=Undibacterium arcticum TaxID=1762892 RepID=UPI00360796A6